MQGKKDYQEKLFTSFRLSDRVPKENFYRRLKEVLDLDFLYLLTQKFYGQSGQKSIDPVVFFKTCLVGYLENIITDRGVMNHCAMRLDILYFLDYDIDEPLPWHSLSLIHISEPTRLRRISYAVFCLKKKTNTKQK